MDGTVGAPDEQPLLRYVAAARPAQQLVGETLKQVAGFALLLMTSPGRASLAEGALAAAADAAARAAEDIRAIPVPGRAAHHHHHMRAAAEALRRACAAALGRRGGVNRDDLVHALRTASDHLRATERLLPGFELIDFGQACCAAHAPPRLVCEVA